MCTYIPIPTRRKTTFINSCTNIACTYAIQKKKKKRERQFKSCNKYSHHKHLPEIIKITHGVPPLVSARDRVLSTCVKRKL